MTHDILIDIVVGVLQTLLLVVGTVPGIEGVYAATHSTISVAVS